MLVNWSLKKICILLTVAIMATTAVSVSVLAQDKKQQKSKYSDAKTTKIKALGQKFSKKLKSINEYMAAENWAVAVKDLIKLDKPKRWKSHEYAHLYNTLGFVYYQMDNVGKALESYLKVIKEKDVTAGVYQNALKTVSQLYLIGDDYPNAIKYLKKWMSLQEQVASNIYALLAQCYYNTKDFDNSLKNIEMAISLDEKANKVAKENWYAIQRAIYYEYKNYPKITQILEKLIIHYANIKYWLELGGIYHRQEKTDEFHATYDLVHLQKGLDTEARLLNLANLYLAEDVPYLAAKIIAEGMKNNLIKRIEKNLRLVGAAFQQARSPEEALPFFEEAAKIDKSGESYSRLASLYVVLERDKDVIIAAEKALKRGKVKRPDLLRLSMVIAYVNQRKLNQAIDVLKKIKDRRSIKSRDSWKKYVKREMNREKQLRDLGIDLSKIYSKS